jgi:formate dehydrogenase subunit gamma
MRQPPGTVSRYTAGARVNHWLTAACLILLALSGLALFDPALFFLTALFGGGAATRAIHPWIGCVLMASFALLFIRFVRYNFWTRDDTRWMGAFRRILANEEEGVPEVGRYNAGQKAYFWFMSIFIVVLFLTGLVMWDRYFFGFTSIPQKRAAVLLHSMVAVLSIMVWIVHVYAALWVRGTVQAMTRGMVTAGWSWRHHRKWLREVVSRPAPPSGPAPSSAPAREQHLHDAD